MLKKQAHFSSLLGLSSLFSAVPLACLDGQAPNETLSVQVDHESAPRRVDQRGATGRDRASLAAVWSGPAVGGGFPRVWRAAKNEKT